MIRILIACLLALSSTIAAAQLTAPQVATLKTACAADSTCQSLATAADDVALAAWFNAADGGGCIVWRPDVTFSEAAQAITWTEVDALTAGKARIWEWMARHLSVIDARQANVRQGISDAFAGAATTRNALTALAKRVATRAEKALASGACTSGSPSIMTWTGPITYADASLIRS